MKSPPKRPGKPPFAANPKSMTGKVSVAITRKYSVRQYETVDIQISVEANADPGETQAGVTARVYEQLKIDIQNMGDEIRNLCKNKEL